MSWVFPVPSPKSSRFYMYNCPKDSKTPKEPFYSKSFVVVGIVILLNMFSLWVHVKISQMGECQFY